MSEITSTQRASWLQPLMIRASAGTGKTFQLSNRLLQLLLSGEMPDHILATTFTRKAAGEILERVLHRLADAIEDPKKLEQLKSHLAPLSVSRQGCRVLLKRLTEQIHRVRVSTLDSFFSQLARSFALELRLPSGWQLIDPQQELRLRRIAVQQLMDHIDQSRLMTLMNLLNKGDFASGVAEEIQRTIESGYGLYRVTTKEAWSSLQVPKSPEDSEIERAIKVVEVADIGHKSAKKGFLKIAEQAANNLWRDLIEQTVVSSAYTNEPTYFRKPLGSDLIQALQILGDSAASRLLAVYRAQTEASWEILDEYHVHLEQLKRARRELTFEDVAHKLAHWLGGDIEASSLDLVAYRLDCRLDHLLLDEFQDTSPIQWEILRPFGMDIANRDLATKVRVDTSSSSAGDGASSFFCVGDSKQAIYGWRGGVAEIFDEVADSIRGVQSQVLQESRRSSPVLMDFVNKVFQSLETHEEFGRGAAAVAKWVKSYPEHTSALANSPGYVLLQNGPDQNDKVGDKEERADGEKALTEDGSEDSPKKLLLKFSAAQIETIARQAPFSSIGVLVRQNDEVGEMIDLLRSRGLDASQEGGNPLTDSTAVEVLLSLLTLADHPGDSIAQFHVEMSPLGRLLEYSPRRDPGRLSALLREEAIRLGLGEFLSHYANLLAESCNERDQLRLERLVQMGFQAEIRGAERLTEFVELVRKQRVALPTPAQIRVMTFHQSKGLEFDAVVLPQMQIDLSGKSGQFVSKRSSPTSRPDGVLRYMNEKLQNFLPDSWQNAFEDEAISRLAEGLCILYVALTRARHGLYLFTPPKKNPTKTFGSLLQTILATGPTDVANAIIFQQGDERWYESIAVKEKKESSQPAASGSVATGATATIKLKMDVPSAKARSMSTFSATQPALVDGIDAEVAAEERMTLAEAFEPSQTISRIEGQALHAWLEHMEWLNSWSADTTRLTSQAIARVARNELARVDLTKLEERLRKYVRGTQFALLMAEKRYQPWLEAGCDRIVLERERRLALAKQGSLILGTIDRMVLGYRGNQATFAEIIDFKSDQLPGGKKMDAWLKQQERIHRRQLLTYRDVIAQQLAISNSQIRLTLFMLEADRELEIKSE